MKKIFTGIVLLATVGGFMVSLESCHDGCEGSKRVSAEFRTYNELYYYDKENGKSVQKIKIVEEDTFMLSYITFEALDANAESYEWTIGSDPRKRTDKKFTLLFKDPMVIKENPLPIKLKIKKSPDSKCFPDDLGLDSVVHFIHFIDFKDWPVYGRYFGSDNTNPENKYTIEVFRGIRDNRFQIEETLIDNLPGNCTGLDVNVKDATVFEFALGTFDLSGYTYAQTPDCIFRNYDKKIGYLKPDRKTIVIEYEFTDRNEQDGGLQKRVFTGIRQ